MAGLQITITDAGRAALVDAPNTGSSAVTISHVGLSAVHTAGSLKSLTALPGEVKRVTTFGGDIVADDVIHVTINDETTDVYSVRAFGLYLSTGVLFAVFSSPDVVVEKNAGAMVLLSADITFKTLETAVIQFGGTGFINPPATTERLGVVELATWEEAVTGNRADLAVTPFGLLKVLQSWATNFAAAVHRHPTTVIDGLPEALAGKSAVGHKHDASDTNSGVFDVGRIPALGMENISGLAAALANKAAAIHGHVMADVDGLVQALSGKSPVGHKHDAADTNSGVFDVGRIPALAMEKITGLASALASKANLVSPTFTGTVAAPTFAASGTVIVNGDGGSERAIYLRTGATNRWRISANAAVETGSNAGSNLAIDRYDDSGVRITTDFTISRATGAATFSGRPSFGAATPWDSANFDPGSKAPLDDWTNKAADAVVSGYKKFVGLGASTIAASDQTGGRAGIEVQGAGGAAYLAFHRPGAHAVFFGLDTDNQLKFGGWSKGQNSYRILHEDNLDLWWPAGGLHLFATASPPPGARLLVAEGQALSRATYARLFAEIGTTFGAGDGSTTFNAPDWRGVFFRGLDRGRGLDSNRQLGVFQSSQNLRHNHSISSRSNADSGAVYVEDAGTSGTAYSPVTGYEGGDEARPVNQALLACISY
jgi:microcystin-dependent protein